MSDRGMKKWAPFKALSEQEDSLKKLQTRSERVPRPLLSIDQEEEINDILVAYRGQEVKISYYRNERIYCINTVIEKIDVSNMRLVLPERKIISFKEIVGLENV